VDFPGPVKVGLPPKLESMVRVQSIAGTIYLLAHREFNATRVMIRETESGRMYLMDVAATGKGEGGSGPPVEVYAGEDSGPPGERRTNDGRAKDASPPALPSYGYVTLTRFAAQQLYAPARLLKDLPGVARVPIKRKKVSLVRGSAVTAEPLAAWRAGDLYLTAVKLTNRTGRALTLDPRTLRGDWLSAAFQHNRLLPKGDESDTTALYLISARPFAASL
jgi:integrating conjugative element protein (TIGR03749 family)